VSWEEVQAVSQGSTSTRHIHIQTGSHHGPLNKSPFPFTSYLTPHIPAHSSGRAGCARYAQLGSIKAKAQKCHIEAIASSELFQKRRRRLYRILPPTFASIPDFAGVTDPSFCHWWPPCSSCQCGFTRLHPWGGTWLFSSQNPAIRAHRGITDSTKEPRHFPGDPKKQHEKLRGN